MKLQLTNKFLHRVRIHGGEFDSSARAMNRAGEKDTLITYERALEAQADLRKFRGSTIERKHMSTKTTFKRVALVAVAALGLGVLATAPSQATVQASSLTLSSATSTQLTNETSTASAAVATLSFLASDVADTVTVTAYLMSAPAGNTKSPVLQVSDTATSAVVRDAAAGGDALAIGAEVTDQTISVNSRTNAATAVTAKLKVYMNSATVAGTYVVKLVPSVAGGGGVIDTTGVTLTITVSTNPATDTVAASATSIIVAAADTTTATDVAVTASKTSSQSAEVAYIKVGLLNAAGVATTGESYSATIAGPGLLGSNALTSSYTDANLGRAITVQAGHVVAVYPDGSSGVSTITISSAAGKVLATETITFFGAPATITATAAKAVIGVGSGLADVLSVIVKDASGTLVSNLTSFGVVSSDTTKISTVYATAVGAGKYTASTGVYLIPVTSVAAGSANLTVTTNTSSADTTGVSAAPVAVRVGSITPAKVTVTTDKSSYAPGEKAIITVALADATGLDLVSGETYTAIFATGGITSSYTLSGATITGTGVVSYVAGGKTYEVFMPVTEGDVKLSWTTGSTASGTNTGLATANQAVAGSITVAVSSVASAAALDAANEATDAANAATDAALAAADAADAATAAAEDASAAVAALAKSVNTALNNLKKQITALTKLVNKLLK